MKKEFRKCLSKCFYGLCWLSTALAVLLLVVLIFSVVKNGMKYLNVTFLTSFPSRIAQNAGIYSALVGSFYLMGLTALISIPLGIGASLYLEEFARKTKLNAFIQLNISNLAGVPSIVYGMLGLVIFVRLMALERSLISGALTMSLLVLPVIIMASQEALKAIPNSIRFAALALGVSKWQMVRDHILPAAIPGMMTGTILALSRAVGETAPLIMIGAMSFVAFTPKSLKDPFTALPIQIYNWASRPNIEFAYLSASAIIVLMVFLIFLNAMAMWLRQKFSTKVRW